MKCGYPSCNNECDIFPNGLFKKHCSKSCCAKDNALRGLEKKKATCVEKYGVEYPIGTATVRQKIKTTIAKRYGVENISQISAVKEKKKKTLIENYGVDHPLKSTIIKDRVKNTLDQRYGVTHVSYIGKSQEEIALLSDPNKIHELNKQYNLYAIAQQYGFSDRTLREILEKNNIEPIFHNNSSFEKEVQTYIQTVYTGKIISGTRILNGKEIDIFLPDLNIGFECNGAYWHSETAGGRNKDYHIDKLQSALNLNINLKQIWDFEWYVNTALIKSMINHTLGLSKRLFARKCDIREIQIEDERTFLNRTHIQGYTPSTISLGLFFNDKQVAIMTFIKSRYDKTYEWELLRFSNELNTSVVGAASRLLKYCINMTQSESILSYSHRHISDGNLYKMLGFEHIRTTGPSYRYTTDYKYFTSRITYQKHKLEKLLPIFDADLTEWQNMQNNGYDRIWDCGNDVWKLKGKK